MAPPRQPEARSISRALVLVLYGVMAAVSYGLGFWLADRNIFFWSDAFGTTLLIDVAVGAGGGVFIVGASRLLERFAGWARELEEGFAEMLGPLDGTTILIIAVCSALGEEMLFRGLLQPAIGLVWSSLVFGLLHIGRDRRFVPWTLMAIGMGFGLGAMYWYTGNLLAPILAHFTINYFNLHSISARASARNAAR